MTTTRIYVGGLGESVTSDDLRKTFSGLGAIETVDVIRTKGRSFAYFNFLPSSDKSLSKLFSAYNGCSWKGGKLRLEKAKEHYIERLKREWTENAELANKTVTDSANADEKIVSPVKSKTCLESDKMQIRIFFPKLRKVKSLPFKGTGKHKYSFQRVETPYLPLHFCDCPEHSDYFQTPTQTRFVNPETINGLTNEEEIGMMNSVMNKLFNNETSAKTDTESGGMTEEEINVMNSVMNKLLERESGPKTQDDASDDDGIIINVVARNNSERLGPESSNQKTRLVNKMTRSSDNELSNHKRKPINKRKSVDIEREEREMASPTVKRKAQSETRSDASEAKRVDLDAEGESHSRHSSSNSLSSAKKTPWRELVGDKSISSFSLSHILQNGLSKSEKRPESSAARFPNTKPQQPISRNGPLEEKDKSNSPLEARPSRSIVGPEKSATVSDDLPGAVSNTEQRLQSSCKSLSETKLQQRVSRNGQLRDENEPKSLSEARPSKSIMGPDKSISVSHELPGAVSDAEQRFQSSVLSLPETKLDQENEPGAPSEARSSGHPLGPEKPIRGNSWVQKSPWTQLVGNGNSSSFSISQILPGRAFNEHEPKEPEQVTEIKGSRDPCSTALAGGSIRFGSSSTVIADVSSKEKQGVHLQQKTSSEGEYERGESCTFMRSESSLREWKSAKAALTGRLNKKKS